MEFHDRRPHAILDPGSRHIKGEKISALISRYTDMIGAHVLDIGTGSGLIAEHFLTLIGDNGRVIGVDRTNQMQTDTVDFIPVSSTDLSFDDGSFDIVVTNHVIEHVGHRNDQHHHLEEIARVLKPTGIIYLAMPNRWAPVEPHFRLPFLSWLPRPMRSPYVRLTGKGEWYDCNPLTRREIQPLFDRCDLIAEEVTLEALQLMAERELPAYIGKPILLFPISTLKLTLGIIPTLIFLARKKISKEKKVIMRRGNKIHRESIMATNIGGIGDAVRHEETGLVVREAVPAEIAAAIERVIDDPGLVERITTTGRALALARFTRRASATAFSALFSNFLTASQRNVR